MSVDNDQPFHNDYGDIMYPGDSAADPANIFNCRCSLSASIKGFPRENPNKGLYYKDENGEISYEDWKAGHYEQKSNPITNQEEISENMKNAYNAEYRKYSLTEDKNDGTINSDYMEQSSHASIPEKYDGDFSDFNDLNLTETEFNAMQTLFELSKKDGIEHLIVIKNGVASKPYDSGLEGRVKLPENEMEGENIKLFHSHTNATPLSSADLEKFARGNISSVGVIAVNGDIFVVNGYPITKEEYREVAENIGQ